MKGILALLLVLLPAIWFYVKFYSRELSAKIQVKMHMDKMYEHIINYEWQEAGEECHILITKANTNPRISAILSNMPMTQKTAVCFEFIDRVITSMEKQLEAAQK